MCMQMLLVCLSQVISESKTVHNGRKLISLWFLQIWLSGYMLGASTTDLMKKETCHCMFEDPHDNSNKLLPSWFHWLKLMDTLQYGTPELSKTTSLSKIRRVCTMSDEFCEKKKSLQNFELPRPCTTTRYARRPV